MRLVLVICLAAWSAGAQALPVEAARSLFERLWEAAQTVGLDAHQTELARLEDYPLYPYLLAADLSWRLRRPNTVRLDTEIAAFIDSYPLLPAARSLRVAWIRDLAARGRWATVIARVNEDDPTSLQCLATTGQIRTGTATAAALRDQALQYWLRGYSQPESCNPVFAWLEATGGLDREAIAARARLAVLADQTGLARYLARKLPEGSRQPISRWINIVENPGDLHTIEHMAPEIAVHAYKKLALRDLEAAAALLPELGQRLGLPAAQLFEARRWVALLFAQNHDPRALAWFAKLDREQMDDFARGWQIRAAILHARWQDALAAIEALPPAQAHEEEWRYWAGRVLEELGREQQAVQVYAALADHRSYHGYLAADQLGVPYSFNREPLQVNAEVRTSLLVRPAIRRAHEFRALDRAYQARVEWRVATNQLQPIALRQAALLAHDWGWHPMAIITLADSDYWDDLGIRYPLHFRAAAVAAAKANNLSPAYVLAIIRTESLFMAAVHSPAGAVGLMQLMPATADAVARELGVAEPDTAALENPALNIRLGSHYLRKMLDRFGGHLALATAAYNAGPSRIESWLPARPLDPLVWIANIPYTETREYVQRAFSHLVVFQMRLGHEIQTLAQLLSPVPTAPILARAGRK